MLLSYIGLFFHRIYERLMTKPDKKFEVFLLVSYHITTQRHDPLRARFESSPVGNLRSLANRCFNIWILPIWQIIWTSIQSFLLTVGNECDIRIGKLPDAHKRTVASCKWPSISRSGIVTNKNTSTLTTLFSWNKSYISLCIHSPIIYMTVMLECTRTEV
jgi:hypothetical protein